MIELQRYVYPTAQKLAAWILGQPKLLADESVASQTDSLLVRNDDVIQQHYSDRG